MAACEICGDEGFYLDRRCREGVCAHPHARGEPMPCPQRPCTCKAGKPFRDALKARIERQNALIYSNPMTAAEYRDFIASFESAEEPAAVEV